MDRPIDVKLFKEEKSTDELQKEKPLKVAGLIVDNPPYSMLIDQSIDESKMLGLKNPIDSNG